MAKGFTVKAAAPKAKAESWDYDAIKERMKGKTIVFCLPGRGCCLLYTSPSPRDRTRSRMPSSA